MGMLGKYLVFANLFISVALFGWALSIYANRLDYFDRKDGEATIEGQLTTHNAEVKRVAEAARSTQGSYAFANAKVQVFEARGDQRTQILRTWIDEVRKGDDEKVTFRIYARNEASGLIDTAPTAAHKVFDSLQNKPLAGLGVLRRQMDKQNKDEKTYIEAIRKAREELQAASLLIYNPATESGAQIELRKLKTIRDNLEDEIEYLSTTKFNWNERLRTLEFRKKQLAQRLAEYGTAANPGDGR